MREPVWVEELEIITLHDRLIMLHGGSRGIRDRSLLSSALARPKQHLAYSADAGIVELAAIYSAGIQRNHPFVDGNKRTGFVAGVLFLELNGYEFFAAEEAVVVAIEGLASGALDEKGYANFLRANCKRATRS